MKAFARAVGGYLALWIILYGFIQAIAPKLTGLTEGEDTGRSTLVFYGGLLALTPAAIAYGLQMGFNPMCFSVFNLTGASQLL